MDAAAPMPGERQAFRWRAARSYPRNVFQTFDYLQRNRSRHFGIAETHRRLPVFRDVLVPRKR